MRFVWAMVPLLLAASAATAESVAPVASAASGTPAATRGVATSVALERSPSEFEIQASFGVTRGGWSSRGDVVAPLRSFGEPLGASVLGIALAAPLPLGLSVEGLVIEEFSSGESGIHQDLAGARLIRSRSLGRLWLGYANATSVSGEPPGSQMVQAGGEAGIGRLSISGSLARSTTAWHVTIPGSTIYAADTIVPPVIPDVEETRRAAGGALRLGGTWSATRWNVATTGGLRWDKSLPAARWLHLEGAWWVAPRLALRLGLGREAADLWQVRPARLGNSLALEWTRPHWQAPASPATTPREVTLRVVSVTGDLRQIEISAPGAHRIEAMGDFTMWEAVELRRWSAGRFRMERHMEPGIYRVLVRRDGGPWMIPANLPGTDDPDLGAAGSLVIE